MKLSLTLLFAGVMILVIGCTKINKAHLSPEEASYFSQVEDCPLEFTIPVDQAEEAWGRAQSFIGRFSSMKIQTTSDYVIQTYNPGSGDVDFGYYVTKTPMGNMVQFTVQCNVGNMFSGKDAKNNAHILAYYIKTGQLKENLIAR